MSKKKNTLNDLEEFLKMQASALVTPAPITQETKQEAPVAPVVVPREAKAKPATSEVSAVASETQLLDGLIKLSAQDKNAFYDLLIRATEKLPNRSKEDTLLINTALYLKGGFSWKETVRDYWKQH
ncbi:MAG: hypothetical protein ACOYW3_03480 [Bacteroidota bacterium]